MPEQTAGELASRLVELRETLMSLAATVDLRPIEGLHSDQLRPIVAYEAERVRVLTSDEGRSWG
jgi:hypothetical protein